ncbi:uncharacterized protein LOC118204529 [Stegodyphus dumicola]|uniref:uncharacterized protein LOC118204529 n=1 Tax=Stegodyphus dumicola TaxID=202533 RepID=UPI0015AB45E1|nr:uncharacterized protein LOC118204529 [Stegodyphus dumicola]
MEAIRSEQRRINVLNWGYTPGENNPADLPTRDESGVIRVGGRLENSYLDYKQAHPIVLPYKDHLTDLIILHSDQVIGDGGTADTLNQIRDKFWLLKAHRKIKSVLYNFNVCKIFRTKPVVQDMEPLPPDRCREAFPF